MKAPKAMLATESRPEYKFQELLGALKATLDTFKPWNVATLTETLLQEALMFFEGGIAGDEG